MGVGERCAINQKAQKSSAHYFGKRNVENPARDVEQDKTDLMHILANVDAKRKNIADEARKRSWRQQEADVRAAVKSNYISYNQGHSNVTPTFQKRCSNPIPSTDRLSNSATQNDNKSPLLGIVVLCTIFGLVGLGGLVTNNTNSSSVSSASSYSRDSNGYGTIPYGNARFKSGRTGKAEIIGVSLSQRKNVNGHIVYDASWADGYDSSYVFWSNGKVEIFSKNGEGKTEKTNASFRITSNGDCMITADTNAVTTFPHLDPIVN
ncbi:MAG: hypothetical protein ISP81_04840 [Synechococcus sp. BS301-5m-G54]|nr:hypothetical protein [Synechococcus sp. BS301-5m-G54]